MSSSDQATASSVAGALSSSRNTAGPEQLTAALTRSGSEPRATPKGNGEVPCSSRGGGSQAGIAHGTKSEEHR